MPNTPTPLALITGGAQGIVEPEDIVAAVRFLAGAQAGFITGQNLIVDGGMTRTMIYAA
jgi:hypothetical protein